MPERTHPEPSSAPSDRMARLTAPIRSTSATGVTIGAWVLACALGVPALVELARLLTVAVLGLILEH